MRIEAEPADRLRAVLAGQPPPRRGPRRALEEADHEQEPEASWYELEPVQLARPPVDQPEEIEPPREPEEPLAPSSGSEGSGPPGRKLVSTARAFTARHLQAIGLVAVLVLVFVAVNLLRARSTEVPLQVADSATSVGASATSTPASSSASSQASTLVVHVTGAVNKPGVVRVPAGSRVNDAIAAAGGLTGRAKLGTLNLAAPVVDGMQVVVGDGSSPVSTTHPPTPGSEGGADDQPDTSGGTGTGPLINVNTASQAQLETLPGVGPVMAGRIVEWREKNGKFSSVQELQEVDGVGTKTFERLKPLVTV